MKTKSFLYKIICLFILMLLAGGCSVKPPMLNQPANTTWEIKSPFASLWQSTIEALVQKGARIELLNKEHGLIVIIDHIDGKMFNDHIVEPFHFDGGEAHTSILFHKNNNNISKLIIKTNLFGYGKSYSPLKLTSNGKIERDYYLLLSGLITNGKSYPWLEESDNETQ